MQDRTRLDILNETFKKARKHYDNGNYYKAGELFSDCKIMAETFRDAEAKDIKTISLVYFVACQLKTNTLNPSQISIVEQQLKEISSKLQNGPDKKILKITLDTLNEIKQAQLSSHRKYFQYLEKYLESVATFLSGNEDEKQTASKLLGDIEEDIQSSIKLLNECIDHTATLILIANDSVALRKEMDKYTKLLILFRENLANLYIEFAKHNNNLSIQEVQNNFDRADQLYSDLIRDYDIEDKKSANWDDHPKYIGYHFRRLKIYYNLAERDPNNKLTYARKISQYIKDNSLAEKVSDLKAKKDLTKYEALLEKFKKYSRQAITSGSQTRNNDDAANEKRQSQKRVSSNNKNTTGNKRHKTKKTPSAAEENQKLMSTRINKSNSKEEESSSGEETSTPFIYDNAADIANSSLTAMEISQPRVAAASAEFKLPEGMHLNLEEDLDEQIAAYLTMQEEARKAQETEEISAASVVDMQSGKRSFETIVDEQDAAGEEVSMVSNSNDNNVTSSGLNKVDELTHVSDPMVIEVTTHLTFSPAPRHETSTRHTLASQDMSTFNSNNSAVALTIKNSVTVQSPVSQSTSTLFTSPLSSKVNYAKVKEGEPADSIFYHTCQNLVKLLNPKKPERMDYIASMLLRRIADCHINLLTKNVLRVSKVSDITDKLFENSLTHRESSTTTTALQDFHKKSVSLPKFVEPKEGETQKAAIKRAKEEAVEKADTASFERIQEAKKKRKKERKNPSICFYEAIKEYTKTLQENYPDTFPQILSQVLEFIGKQEFAEIMCAQFKDVSVIKFSSVAVELKKKIDTSVPSKGLSR